VSAGVDFTVLGKSPAMPDAGGAHSGYLIRHAGFTLLLDCGGGVFAKLRSQVDPATVDAVLITHLHADHILDLLPFSFALGSGQIGQGLRPPLWGPPGARAALAAYSAAVGMEDQINEGFTVGEYEPSTTLELGPFSIRFCEVPHYIRAWACDLSCQTGRRLTFGGDCGPNDAVVELGRNTNLMLLEATEGAHAQHHDGLRGHLSAAEAGAMASRAQAGRLMLTHYSDLLDAAALRSAAQAAFGGPVELATEGARCEV
jgi:ribonuclease BN (tRNA processing enzyme)